MWWGLGPIIDMLPFRTLYNCGNSSKLKKRRNTPIRVKRSSFGVICLKQLPWSQFAKVRNLYILKGSPFKPVRHWLYITGPEELILTKIDIINRRGLIKTRITGVSMNCSIKWNRDLCVFREDEKGSISDLAFDFLWILASETLNRIPTFSQQLHLFSVKTQNSQVSWFHRRQ